MSARGCRRRVGARRASIADGFDGEACGSVSEESRGKSSRILGQHECCSLWQYSETICVQPFICFSTVVHDEEFRLYQRDTDGKVGKATDHLMDATLGSVQIRVLSIRLVSKSVERTGQCSAGIINRIRFP